MQNHKRLRRQWCDERRMWAAEWNEVVFTDESRICLQHHDGRIRVWRHRGVVKYLVYVGGPTGKKCLSSPQAYTMGVKYMTGWVSTSGTIGSNLKSETQTGAKILWI
ncbi:transposable element Tcb1 transposase [Trichonephila clavipes]|uniref:Transposable element Tcb1 transposase n=1 Tax=Trichonephila clavipes TaxID=2585209 RepID=A0A8X6WFB3_TRICX|nr:transposable element Tcb1 transposase [Trichonephila clavipes]